MPPIPQPPRPPPDGNALRYLQDLHQWLGLYVAGSSRGLPSQPAASASASHPFKLAAVVDAPDAPTSVLVSVVLGTLQGSLASGSTYSGVPRFEGDSGDRLDADPAPTFEVGIDQRTSYFYLKVTTNNYGLISDVSIVRVLVAGNPPAETNYVQPGYPAPTDTGTNGVYYWLLGSVVVALAAGLLTATPANSVTTNMGFFVCGAGGRFYRA